MLILGTVKLGGMQKYRFIKIQTLKQIELRKRKNQGRVIATQKENLLYRKTVRKSYQNTITQKENALIVRYLLEKGLRDGLP